MNVIYDILMFYHSVILLQNILYKMNKKFTFSVKLLHN
jgi:hypothetical protein